MLFIFLGAEAEFIDKMKRRRQGLFRKQSHATVEKNTRIHFGKFFLQKYGKTGCANRLL
ncbi:MAG: hypothetical protein ACKVU2_06210 [Saprospiraceae bacterium]